MASVSVSEESPARRLGDEECNSKTKKNVILNQKQTQGWKEHVHADWPTSIWACGFLSSSFSQVTHRREGLNQTMALKAEGERNLWLWTTLNNIRF